MTEPAAPRVAACANKILERVGLMRNAYFRSLEDGLMSKADFVESQEQFFFAVRYFSRPMSALISRMPDPARHVEILRNIVEEHGDFQPGAFHQNTFRAFLLIPFGPPVVLCSSADQRAVPTFVIVAVEVG